MAQGGELSMFRRRVVKATYQPECHVALRYKAAGLVGSGVWLMVRWEPSG